MGKRYALICPRCGERHNCPRSWYMFSHPPAWIGYICIIYCELDPFTMTIYKLYDMNMNYVTFVTSLIDPMNAE